MTRLLSFLRPAAALALALFFLAGCWVPEHYIARIKIERDGTYKVFAEGTAVHPESYRAMRRVEAETKAGKLKPEDLKKRTAAALEPLQKALDELKGDTRIMDAKSVGDGRVRFTVSGVWSLDRGLLIFNELQVPLAYAVVPDGSLRLHVKDAVPGWEAKSLAVTQDGELSVLVAEGVEVLEHNAQKKPSAPGGAYRWHLDGSTAQAPFLRVRLPAPVAPAGPAQAPAAQKKLAHH